MTAICQFSYLFSFSFFPQGSEVSGSNWQALSSDLTFEEYSIACLSDAIESIARVWLHVWEKYLDWLKKQ